MKKDSNFNFNLVTLAALSSVILIGQGRANITTQPTQCTKNKVRAERHLCSGSPHKGQERCYGIAKAGKNACAAKMHGCSGLSKKTNDPREWLVVPKGTCNKIAGGHLNPTEKESS